MSERQRTVTPEKLAACGTEDGHQAALFCWAADELAAGRHPELEWLHSIPNGGERGKASAGRMKATGVKAGVWDCFLPVRRGGYSGLYVELKKPGRERERNGGLQQNQIDFGLFAQRQGYRLQIAYGWQPARDCILSYLALDHV